MNATKITSTPHTILSQLKTHKIRVNRAKMAKQIKNMWKRRCPQRQERDRVSTS